MILSLIRLPQRKRRSQVNSVRFGLAVLVFFSVGYGYSVTDSRNRVAANNHLLHRHGSSSVSSSTASASTTTTSNSKQSVPRSISGPRKNLWEPGVAPWRLSPNIDKDGFLKETYRRVPGEWEGMFPVRSKYIKLDQCPPVRIRQVPGDGNCLFHAVSVCYARAVNGTDVDLVGLTDKSHIPWLADHSTQLRQIAVDCLEKRRNVLYLQGREYLPARELVDAAASQYDISGKEYCELMRKDSYWGGGPEICALCNALRRPIHVYELHVPEGQTNGNNNNRRRNRKKSKRSLVNGGRSYDTDNNDSGDDHSTSSSSTKTTSSSFVLRRMACFGSPKYDRHEPLHILSADSRFPDVTPGEQLSSGNHFLAIFPEPIHEESSKKQSGDNDGSSRGRIRGGYYGNGDVYDSDVAENDEWTGSITDRISNFLSNLFW